MHQIADRPHVMVRTVSDNARSAIRLQDMRDVIPGDAAPELAVNIDTLHFTRFIWYVAAFP